MYKTLILSVNVTEIYSFPYMHKAILTPSFYHDIVCYDTHRWIMSLLDKFVVSMFIILA